MPSKKLIQTTNVWLSCTEYVISTGMLWGVPSKHGHDPPTQKKNNLISELYFYSQVIANTCMFVI